MSASDYFIGAAFLLATYGAVFAATEIFVRRRLGALRGAVRAVAWAVVATAALIAVTVLPAALTVLSREATLVAALALLGLSTLIRPAVSPADPGRSAARALGEPERLLAMIGIAGAAIWLVAALVKYLEVEPTGFDAASAYLPTAARWLQEGSIWQIADWVPNAFYGSGPGNGSVIVLSAMLPWDNDFLAHLAMYPYVVLFPVVLYALARECGAPAPAAILLGLMIAAAPVVVQPGTVDGLLDPVMYSTLAAGILFLVRHNRTAARSDLLLAGLALGLCFGTKFYGYTSVAVVIAVWTVARLACRVELKRVIVQTLTLGAVILAAGGIWMVRNWVETGNPLMPLKIEFAGLAIFDAPPDPQRPLFGDSLASYFDQPAVWVDTLAHQFRIAVGIPLLVIAGLVVGAIGLLAVRRRRGENDGGDRVALAAVAAALLAALVYAATPYSAPGIDGDPVAAAINVRYGIPAMIVAVAAAGWLAGKLGRGLSIALCAVALIATIDALRVATVTRPAVVYASFAIGAVLALALWWWTRDRDLELPSVSATAVAAVAGVILLVAVVAGKKVSDDFNADRYLGADPVIGEVIANSDRVYADTGEGATVGLAGYWSLQGVVPTYPTFGTRLQNRVEYVGRTEDALLRAYTEKRGFQESLSELNPDALILGLDENVIFPEGERPAGPAALRAWAEELGYTQLEIESPRFELFVKGEPAA